MSTVCTQKVPPISVPTILPSGDLRSGPSENALNAHQVALGMA